MMKVEEGRTLTSMVALRQPKSHQLQGRRKDGRASAGIAAFA